jgi:hypothetical protein
MGLQDSLSGTAVQLLILSRCFCSWTDQDLHLATETEQDRMRLPLLQFRSYINYVTYIFDVTIFTSASFFNRFVNAKS